MDDTTLRGKLIRLAHEKPALREKLLPLIRASLQAEGKLAFMDDTSDFVQWALWKNDRKNAMEVQKFLERLGLELYVPVEGGPGPKRGPLDVGESVMVDKTKNTNSSNVDACEKWHEQFGDVDQVNDDSVVVKMRNGTKVQFMGTASGAATGLYRKREAQDYPGRAQIEVVYLRPEGAKPPSKARQDMVEKYVEKGLQKGEQRVEIYYTGIPTRMALGKANGFYFGLRSTQRSLQYGGGDDTLMNPTTGKVLYIGVLNRRPGGWRAEWDRYLAKSGVAV